MTCRPGDPCFPDLTGMVIKGRSTPGYDYNAQPQNIGGGPQRSGLVATNGAHKYPVMGAGVPNQGMALGGARVGALEDPPFAWGTLAFGVIIGLIVGVFMFTRSGRGVSAAALGRAEKRIRDPC